MNQRHIWDSSSWEKAGASEVAKKTVKEKGNREMSGVWYIVKSCLKIGLESFRLLSEIWARVRDTSWGNSIHTKEYWCYFILLVWKSLKVAIISTVLLASGLDVIHHLEMWLIVAYSVPGGVVTAKQNKIQKRKRCIFIMGTVSKL